MPDENTGGLAVVITIAVLALILGCVAGSMHIGQQTSQQILPTSLLSSEDQIKPVTENNEPTTKHETTQTIQTTPKTVRQTILVTQIEKNIRAHKTRQIIADKTLHHQP